MLFLIPAPDIWHGEPWCASTDLPSPAVQTQREERPSGKFSTVQFYILSIKHNPLTNWHMWFTVVHVNVLTNIYKTVAYEMDGVHFCKLLSHWAPVLAGRESKCSSYYSAQRVATTHSNKGKKISVLFRTSTQSLILFSRAASSGSAPFPGKQKSRWSWALCDASWTLVL